MTKNIPPVKIRSDTIDSYYNYELRDARVEAGYTLEDLGDTVGVTAATMCSYERLRAVPNPLIARRISRKLNRKISELFPRYLRKFVKEIKSERYRDDVIDEAVSLTSASVLRDPFSQDDPEESTNYSDLQKTMGSLLNTLSFREKKAIESAYSLKDNAPKNREALAKRLGISSEFARQIEAKAMRKLQQPRMSKRLVDFID
jgi:DNA-binding XRE family transcriptional regulator